MKKTAILTCILSSFLLCACGKSEFENYDFTDKYGNSSENVYMGSMMAVNENYIYIPWEGQVLEIDKNTGEILKLENINFGFGYINVVDNYIFYPERDAQGEVEGLVVKSLDGKYKKRILKDEYVPFVVYGDWIYATKFRGGEFVRINSKTSKVEALAEAPVEEFNIYDEVLFYSDGNNVYEMKLDGSNRKVLLSDITVFSITNMTGKSIINFIYPDKGYSIYSYDYELNKLSIVKEGYYDSIQLLSDSRLVALRKDGTLELIDLDDLSSNIIADKVGHINIFDNIIYFQGTNQVYYRYLESTKEVETILDPFDERVGAILNEEKD